MKDPNKILAKLNGLLIYTHEVEKIYIEAYNSVNDKTLKIFFKERAFERSKFGEALRFEIKNLNETPKLLGSLSKGFYKTRMRFRNLILLQNEDDLLEQVFNLKKETINKYNELLMQMNLPLHLCKTILKQRDSVQATMRTLKREHAFVA
ncbi:DUF2383 domain-containing protein [Gelatiniphilus marinus]|uniref:DUF2383 domain-containing protein n=1 Tax=Gelatiniphilus marinus TaxID=1759464 RepID=A0ABW5JNX3_9FLAO